MRLLPLRMISHPVKGMASNAPTEEASNTNPNLPSLIWKISCTRGNRAARLAWINPLMKKISFTAMRDGLKRESFRFKIIWKYLQMRL